jgi:GT2 family glycosyltransferase
MPGIKVAIIIPCMGRLQHLRQLANAVLGLATDPGFDYEIVVVDYGCPEGTFAWCVELDQRRLNCLRVEDDVALFNKSRCNNIGARCSQGDVLAFLDVDKIPPVDFLTRTVAVLAAGHADMVHFAVTGEALADGTSERYRFAPRPLDLEGPPVPGERPCLITTTVTRTVWQTIRGFDEGFDGWGYEDVDFRERALAAGFRDWWLGGAFEFINHGAGDSTRFYRSQDKAETARLNLRRLEDRARAVNPAGFGRAANLKLHGLLR